MEKLVGSGSISHRYGSGDPDPHQNVMDPQHYYITGPITLGDFQLKTCIYPVKTRLAADFVSFRLNRQKHALSLKSTARSSYSLYSRIF